MEITINKLCVVVFTLICLKDKCMAQDQCSVSDSEKRDCGYTGIGEEECTATGCCWRTSRSPDVPWCFDRNTPIAYQDDRVEDGLLTICGAQLNVTTEVQQFASPGWPMRYPRNQNCTWVLRTAPGNVIQARVSVRLEGPDQEDGTCRYDSVTFALDGGQFNSSSPKQCGTTDVEYYSTDNVMQIRFVCDRNREERGILVNFTSVRDYCHLQPCQNGGTCRNRDDGPLCLCALGYGGQQCEDEASTIQISTRPNVYNRTGIKLTTAPRILVMDMQSCSYGYIDLVGEDRNVYWKIKIKSTSIGVVNSASSTYNYVAIYKCNCTTGANRVTRSFHLVGDPAVIQSYRTHSCTNPLSFWIAWTPTTIPNIGLGRVPGEYSFLGSSNVLGVYRPQVNLTVELKSSYAANWTIYKTFNMTEGICGGSLTTDGAIRQFASPGWPAGYAPGLHCEWVLSAPTGQRISLLFNHIRMDSNCKRDSILVYDGTSSTGQSIGELCAWEDNINITSSSNVVTVAFLTDSTREYYGFIASYVSDQYPDDCVTNSCLNGATCVDGFRNYTCICAVGFNGRNCSDVSPCASNPCQNDGTCRVIGSTFTCSCRSGTAGTTCSATSSCSGNLSTSDEVKQVASRNYPSSYRSSDTCTYTINAPTGRQVLLSFVTFSSEACCDCLSVYDGASSSSTRLGKFCGSVTPNTFLVSTSGKLYLRMTSDGSITRQGFLANYTLETDDCTSNPCQNGGNCIDGAKSYTCNCTEQYLGTNCEILDGNDCVSGPCQNDGQCTDLRGDYSCNCTGPWVGKNCSSPNYCYENPCMNEGVCTTFFNGPSRNFTCQCVNGFRGATCNETSPCTSSPCQNGGTCTPSPNNIKGYTCSCRTGFYGNYNCSIQTACGGSLNVTSDIQQFASPGYPSNYGDYQRCTRTFKAPTGQHIMVVFDMFRSETCCDCLMFYPGTSTTSTYIKKFCGSARDTVRSTSNVMTAVFTSDSSVTGRGFLANYTIDEDECESPDAVCQNNGTCVDSIGTYTCDCPTGYRGQTCQYDDYCLSSPCQNDGTCVNLPTNFTCNCTIGYKGNLCEIEDMIIHLQTAYNGLRKNSVMHINGPNVLTFEASCHSEGINLSLRRNKSPSSAVQYEVRIEHGTIPRVYLRPCRCDRYDNYADLELNSCNGTGQYWVAWGYSTLRFGFGLIPGQREIIGASFDRNVQTNLWLAIKNDYGYATNWTIYRKANLTVPRECGGLLKTSSSEVQKFGSPNWPGGYDHNTFCEWILTTSPQHVIVLRFTDFQLQSSSDCKPDNVVLYEGPSSTGRMVGELCGGNETTVPSRVGGFEDRLFLDHNEFAWVPSFQTVLSATLVTDGTVEEKGFVAEYYSMKQFRNSKFTATDNEQTLTSPLPNTQEAVSIFWEITSLPGTRINITVEDFVIIHQRPSRYTCEHARVFVHDVHNDQERTLFQCVENRQRDCPGSFCSPLNRTTLQSTKNDIIVVFSRAPQVTANVRIKYKFVKDTDDCQPSPCRNGGTCQDGSFSYTCMCVQGFTGPQCQYSGCNGTLVAEHTPQEWSVSGSIVADDDAERCTWLITAPTGTKVEVTVDKSSTLLDSYCNETGLLYRSSEKSSWKSVCDSATSDYNSMKLWFQKNITGFHESWQSDTFKFTFRAVYDVDDCIDHKCINNGKCIDGRFSYTCQCEIPYAGTHCEEYDGNDCVGHKCENGATCIDGKLNYTCVCPHGFIGQHCNDIDYCMNEPCAQGSTCINLPFTYECQCPTNLYGRTCEETILRKCGGSLPRAKEEVQHFASPGYPIRYPMNQNCVWNITADAGYFIVVDFNDFELEEPQPSGECAFDYVSFTPVMGSLSGQHMCGTRWNHIRSASNQLVMTFASDRNRQYKGFMANYSMVPDYCLSEPCQNGGKCQYASNGFTCECSQTTDGIYYAGDLCDVEVHSMCGGDLKATKEPQHFVSPGYPNEYQANKVCTWNIQAKDEGYKITLEFDEGFKLPYSPNCTSDRLEIYDGSDTAESNKVGTFCHDKHQQVDSTTSSLTVILRTFTDHELYGIHGKYYSVYDGCASTPCQNDGTCTVNEGDTYECLCPETFVGSHCTVKSKCYPTNPCGRFGKCEDIGGSFKCTCTRGYTGEKCDHKQEDTLRKVLIEGYSKSVSPTSKSFLLKLGLMIQHIYTLDVHKHKLELLIQLKQMWNDQQLEWKPQENYGQTQVSLTAPDIWTPDIAVKNGIQRKSAGVEMTLSVQNTGEVTSVSASELSTSCGINLKWFPYDTQHCDLTFGSSAYDFDKMKLDVINEEESRGISPKLVNTKWKLADQRVTVRNDSEFSTLTFTLDLKRDGSHYGFTHIFPVVLLALVTIIYLFLRPIEIVKYIIGVAVLISCVILVIVLGNEITLSGTSTPILAIFYFLVFLIVSISLIICAVINNLIIKSRSMYHPPHVLKKLLLGPCSRPLCIPAYMRYENFGISMKEMGFVNQLHQEEQSFVDDSNLELSRSDSAAPLNGDHEEEPTKSFNRMNSTESETDSKNKLHIWHIIAIAADRLLLILLIIIILVIGIAALAK